MKIIVNADDFGYSQGVNYGIIDSFKEGIVKSTTMLATMPGFLHACELAKAHPKLDVGVHLALDLGKPTLKKEQIPTLVDDFGHFFSFQSWNEPFFFSPEEVYSEWKNQIETIVNQGVKISHIDSHHHLHMQPRLLPVFLQLANDYQLAIRFFPYGDSMRQQEQMVSEYPTLKRATDFTSDFFAEGATRAFFDQLDGKESTTLEIMAHPAYLDQTLCEGSSYLNERIKEVTILTDPTLKAQLETKKIEIISFSEL